MSEFMGLIVGTYEAKEGGFQPGGASLHSMYIFCSLFQLKISFNLSLVLILILQIKVYSSWARWEMLRKCNE